MVNYKPIFLSFMIIIYGYNSITNLPLKDYVIETNSKAVEKLDIGGRESVKAFRKEANALPQAGYGSYEKAYSELYANHPELTHMREDKTTYLTFDDGPNPNTLKILDILDKYNIKATFFVVGKNVEYYPEILLEIANRGHMIGIHTYSHNYSLIYSSVDAYLSDFYKTYKSVKEITGLEPYSFRFPGGSVNEYNSKTRKAIAEEMNRRGFIFYDWNSSCEDATPHATVESCVLNVRKSSINKYNILLCHDIKPVTVKGLERYIFELKASGYKYFDTLEGVIPVNFFKGR